MSPREVAWIPLLSGRSIRLPDFDMMHRRQSLTKSVTSSCKKYQSRTDHTASNVDSIPRCLLSPAFSMHNILNFKFAALYGIKFSWYFDKLHPRLFRKCFPNQHLIEFELLLFDQATENRYSLKTVVYLSTGLPPWCSRFRTLSYDTLSSIASACPGKRFPYNQHVWVRS